MKKLFYNKPAYDWNEALPIGNGFMGAMVFGQLNKERIQLNEDSVWSGGFIDRTNQDSYNHLEQIRSYLFEGEINKAERLATQAMVAKHPHMRHYQTFADVWIEFFNNDSYIEEIERDESGLERVVRKEKEAEGYKRELNLENASIDISYQMEESKHHRKAFASYKNNVIVYRIKSTQKEKLNFEVSMTRKDLRSGRGASYLDEVDAFDNQYIKLLGHQGSVKNGLDFSAVLKVEAVDGHVKQIGSHIIVESATEAIIYMTGRTSYRSEDPLKWCVDNLDQASEKGYQDLLDEHISDYQQYFNKIKLNLHADSSFDDLTVDQRLSRVKEGKEDLGLLQLYADFGRYLLISASRKGSLPANLQGIWNQDFAPAWGSKYTININIQMNYWIAEKLGLSDLHLPLLEHLKKIRERGKKVAKDMYGARGFVCHHNTDIWGDAAPQDSHIPATIWPMGGAWLCLHIFEHYQYTRDQSFLKEYFPIIKDAVMFFIDYMVKNKQGEYLTGPSVSPENIFVTENGQSGSLTMAPSMDSQILSELFQDYLAILKELNITDDDLEDDVKERLRGLPEIKIGKHGQIQEWLEDYEELEPGHRHISHLFALYPGNQINVQKTPELANAAKETLRKRLESGGGHTGWSKAWIINFWAKLLEPQKAWENISELLMHSTLDNLFDNHPPFQIDGNFGGVNGIYELLLQNYDDTIYILPALPQQLNSGSMEGLRTKEGVIIDIYWEDMVLRKLTIHGLRSTNINICIPSDVNQSQVEINKEIFIEENQKLVLDF